MELDHSIETTKDKEDQPSKRLKTLETKGTSASYIKTKTQNYFITLSSGLEFLAEEEIKERLAPSVLKRADKMGKVFFATNKPLEEVLKLRSADNVYAFVSEHSGVPSDSSGLNYLQNVTETMEWEPALDLWRKSLPLNPPPAFRSSEDTTSISTTTPVSAEETTSESKIRSSTATFPTGQQNAQIPIPNPASLTIFNVDAATVEPLFRVTGKREGDHTYRSPEVAGAVGAGLIRKYGWKVNLKRFNMEVFADLHGDTLVVGISLSPVPLWQSMVRLARIEPGQTVMDPMMGTGTIPIEAADVWKNAYHIGGDISEEAISSASSNMKEAGVFFDIFLWNVYKIPLRTESIDITISDIPFGVRVGSNKKNQKLYPHLFSGILVGLYNIERTQFKLGVSPLSQALKASLEDSVSTFME